MPAWCISDVLTCGAADASPDLRAYHQHLQQSGRFAHRALPFVYHCQRRLGRHDPLSGPGAGRFGITVNAIAAGLTAGTASSAATTEDVRERIIAMTPLGRLARPDDIAGGVALLASDMAGFITGQCLHVDGGLTMR